MVKVITYVDGFNLYFGLRDSGYKKYYWLNIRALAQNLLMLNQELVMTKYFTARITNPPDKEKRQRTYIDALETLRDYKDFEIYYGSYSEEPFKCSRCNNIYDIPHGKKTDVNIATEMLLDAFDNKFEKALLISADADLVPPIQAIRSKYPTKSIVVGFPPSRHSVELETAANSSFYINRATLARSRFDDKVKKADGFILERPVEWH